MNQASARMLDESSPSSSSDPVIQRLHLLAAWLRERARRLNVEPRPLPRPRWEQEREPE